jgi:hypothetical protein
MMSFFILPSLGGLGARPASTLPNICEETSQHLLEIRSIASPVPARILYRSVGGWVLIVLAEIKPELLDTDSARNIERYCSFVALSSQDRFSDDRADDRQHHPRAMAFPLTWTIGRAVKGVPGISQTSSAAV